MAVLAAIIPALTEIKEAATIPAITETKEAMVLAANITAAIKKAVLLAANIPAVIKKAVFLVVETLSILAALLDAETTAIMTMEEEEAVRAVVEMTLSISLLSLNSSAP